MIEPHRIAMWSGPRNLSTAIMRAFGARGDCSCIDEPFYAHYLDKTGFAHPMRDQILNSQPRDWQEVLPTLTRGTSSRPIQYQKHMVQHMLPQMPINWTLAITNIFLIREPGRVVASFSAKRGLPDAAELGFERQLNLFNEMRAGGIRPVVIDSADIRRDPQRALRCLCEAIGIPYTDRMLHWSQGPLPEDGIWGQVWYDAVNRSTGFAGAEGPLPELDAPLSALAKQLRPAYDAIAAHKLVIR